MRVLGFSVRGSFAIFSLLCCLYFLCVSPAQAQTSFNYPPFPATSATGLQVNGNAVIVAPESGSNYLQLTPALGDKVGSAWYTNPSGQGGPGVPLSLANGFYTYFTFQLSEQGGITGSNGEPGADGISFMVQGSGLTAIGSDGGNIGITGITNSVAVQFDTWYNSEFGDTAATNDKYSSADQITVESCGAAANTVNHTAKCQFGTVDLSTLANPIYLADGNPHFAQISYIPPPPGSEASCPPGSTFNTPGCGSLTITLDNQPVLSVPFSLSYLGLDANQDAYAGFTGATGGAWELQNVTAWTFIASTPGVTPVVNNNIPSTPSNIPTTYNSNPTTLLTTNLDYSSSSSLSYPSDPCPQGDCTIESINNPITQAQWTALTAYTPWAMSSCTPKAGNNGLCAQYVNVCYQTSVGPIGASDFNCPSVPAANLSDPTQYIGLLDTWVWPSSGPFPPPPGTTYSVVDFTPSTASEQWLPVSASPNTVCSNVQGTASSTAPVQCDIADKFAYIIGDQTTSRSSSKPKASTFVTATLSYMPLTQVVVNGNANCPNAFSPLNNISTSNASTFESPTFAATIWNNGACTLDFHVNPANPTTTWTNGYLPAPPATFFWGSTVPVPAVVPYKGAELNSAYSVPVPANDTLYANPNPTFSKNCQTPLNVPGPCVWDLGLTATLTSLFGEGPHTIHWSSSDTVGISEKGIQYLQYPANTGATCPNPDSIPTFNGGEPGIVSSTLQACFSTNYFTTQVNVDSVAPVLVSGCAPDTTWSAVDVSIACSAGDVTSGIGLTGASPAPASGLPVGPEPATFAFNVATSTPTGFQGTANTSTQTLCDLALNCSAFGTTALIDKLAPVITITTPAPITYTAYQVVDSAYTCNDGAGSGVATCAGPVASGAPINTKPLGTSTGYSFTVNTKDNVGNPNSSTVNYTVSCHYASVQLKSTTLNKGLSLDPAATMLTDCEPTTQKVIIELTLTGPFGKSCSNSTQLLFFPVPVTIPANTNKSLYPGVILFVPANACSGPNFTFTTSTYSTNGTLLDSVSEPVSVK
jgi:Bacterial lectin